MVSWVMRRFCNRRLREHGHLLSRGAPLPCVFGRSLILRAQNKHTDINYFVLETGFGVLSAVPGRKATFHD